MRLGGNERGRVGCVGFAVERLLACMRISRLCT